MATNISRFSPVERLDILPSVYYIHTRCILIYHIISLDCSRCHVNIFPSHRWNPLFAALWPPHLL